MSKDVGALVASLFVVGFEGTILDSRLRALLDARVGGVVVFRRNVESLEQLRSLCREICGCYSSEYPPLLSVDHEGGTVHRFGELLTHFPPAMALGATGDRRIAYRVYRQMALELGHVGFNTVFAPVVDLADADGSSPLTTRCFSSDAGTVAELAGAAISGVRDGGILPTIKHFPGLGGVELDTHLALPVISRNVEAEARHLLPFERGARDGVPLVMTAHVSMSRDNEKPRAATLDGRVLERLRRDLHFSGVIVSDDLCMKGVRSHDESLADVAIEALLAGVDLLLVCDPEEDITRVVSRIATEAERHDRMRQRVEEAAWRVHRLRGSVKDPRASQDDNTRSWTGLRSRGEKLAELVASSCVTRLGAASLPDLNELGDESPLWLAVNRTGDHTTDVEERYTGVTRRILSELRSYHSFVEVLAGGTTEEMIPSDAGGGRGDGVVVVAGRSDAKAIGRVCDLLNRKGVRCVVLWMSHPGKIRDVARRAPVVCCYGSEQTSIAAAVRVLFGRGECRGEPPTNRSEVAFENGS